ncbi:hypothetical protein EKL28_18745, partial [Staphylococcus aureus]
LATERYMQTVRPDAPWCPDNIEFIRRINGLKDKQAVKDVVYNASYLVMGLPLSVICKRYDLMRRGVRTISNLSVVLMA